MVILMDYLDVYRSRCGGTNGSGVNSVIQQSKNTYVSLFKSNPSYTQVAYNGDYIDTIITNEKDYKDKHISFLPGQQLKIGDLIEFESKGWLVTDFQTNKVFPYGKIQLCNDALLVPIPDSQEPTGDYDEFGNPTYQTVSHAPASFPCVLRNINDAINNRSTSPVIITTGTIEITIGYTTDPNLQYINENVEFHMVNHKYKIFGIDYCDMIQENMGLIHIYANKVADDGTEITS